MKDNMSALLNKEVSRKEFLQHVGIAILALIGVGGLLKTLSESSKNQLQQSSQSGFGYGSGTYGGIKKR
jgi:arginine exporter protein ArgO